MRIFISGISGFLGSHMAESLSDEDHRVIGIDDFSGGYLDNIPDDVACVDMDMTNPNHQNDIKYMMDGCDTVVHCAASPHEGVSNFAPGFICNNIYSGSVNIFSAAIAAKVKRIVFCSSMARYGVGKPPFEEHHTPTPVDPYGISKLAAEDVLRNLSHTHGFEYTIAVPHNIYGPRQDYMDPYRNVASIFVNAMLLGKRPIIYGDGEQMRCFSYISDCVDCLTSMVFDDNVVGHVINVGPDKGWITINELYWKIANIVGFTEGPNYMPGRPREVKHAMCSSDKARRMLGYETKVDLDEGLVKLVDWIKEKGPQPFNYDRLQLEFTTNQTPKNWTDRLLGD